MQGFEGFRAEEVRSFFAHEIASWLAGGEGPDLTIEVKVRSRLFVELEDVPDLAKREGAHIESDDPRSPFKNYPKKKVIRVGWGSLCYVQLEASAPLSSGLAASHALAENVAARVPGVTVGASLDALRALLYHFLSRRELDQIQREEEGMRQQGREVDSFE